MLLHFGSVSAPLYGVYDPAVPPRRRRGVVILNPWGWESIRAHRTLRALASRLAAHGLDVLRFDYSGTGDSFGSLEGATVATWLEDAETALDELLGMAGVDQAAVVGLRLGGLLAPAVAGRRALQVDRLVCWEPFLSGGAFLDSVKGQLPSGPNPFLVPQLFRESIADIDLSPLEEFRGHAMVISAEPVTAPKARSTHAVRTHPDNPQCWVEDRHFGAGAVPTALINDMANWLGSSL